MISERQLCGRRGVAFGVAAALLSLTLATGAPARAATGTGGQTWRPAVPASAFTPMLSAKTEVNTRAGREWTEAAAAEVGWRVALVTASLGLFDTDIVGYAATVPGVRLNADERAFLAGTIRSAAGGPEHVLDSRIGTVSYATLRAQIRSNLATLERALPGHTVLRSAIVPVPVDAATDDYAFEVDIAVKSLATLKPYLGDVFDGLDTGLAGATDAQTEGLAISIVDPKGRRAGMWSAERTGLGLSVADPVVQWTAISETTTFRNLTGVQTPTGSSVGGE